jgi:hypothetical protein
MNGKSKLNTAMSFIIENVCDYYLFAMKARSVEDEVNGEVYRDVSNEFLEPLTATVMLDPVRLPSGEVVDRRTKVQPLPG